MIRKPTLALLALCVSSACGAQTLQATQFSQANSASPLTPSSWAQPLVSRPIFQSAAGPITPTPLGALATATPQTSAASAAAVNAQLPSAASLTAPLSAGPAIELPALPSTKTPAVKIDTSTSASVESAPAPAPAPKRVFNGAPEDTPNRQLQWGYDTLNRQEAAGATREQAMSARYAALSNRSSAESSNGQSSRIAPADLASLQALRAAAQGQATAQYRPVSSKPEPTGELARWSQIARANGHSEEKINLERSRKSPEQFKAWVELTAQPQ